MDLVSPWCAAVEANPEARRHFQHVHTALLEALRLAHTPHLEAFPLLTDIGQLKEVSKQVAAPAFRNHLATVVNSAAALSVAPQMQVVLLPTVSLLDPFPAIPGNPGVVTLGCSSDPLDTSAMGIALARGVALFSRWQGQRGDEVWLANSAWDPWEIARQTPLREWLYAHGIAWHLAEQLHPKLAAHQLFGVSASTWQRLRQRESVVQTELVEEWEQCGIGPLLRWLPADGMVGPASVSGATLPPRMGHYLSWRLTAARVERLGLAEALKADAE